MSKTFKEVVERTRRQSELDVKFVLINALVPLLFLFGFSIAFTVVFIVVHGNEYIIREKLN